MSRIRRYCTGDEMVNESTYEMEKQLQFVSDAVLAFAFAFREMHKDLCGGISGLCPAMSPIDGETLLQYLRRVEFTGELGRQVIEKASTI